MPHHTHIRVGIHDFAKKAAVHDKNLLANALLKRLI